jgi:hypothetical protein
VSFGSSTTQGAIGLFYPTSISAASGALFFDPGNPFGCEIFKAGAVPAGSVLVFSRGGCFFHNKTLHAEMAGAAAVIIVNQKNREMISMMDSVEDLPILKIPAVLVTEEFKWMLTTGVNGIEALLKKPSVTRYGDTMIMYSPQKKNIIPLNFKRSM